MGGGVSGVKVGRAVGGALASEKLSAVRSEGIGGWKRKTSARALASVTVGFWDGSRKPFVCGSSSVWDGWSDGYGKPLVLFLLGQHGRQCRGQNRSTRWWQRGRRLWVATTPAAARSLESDSAAARASARGSMSGTSAGKGIGIRESVSEGVGVGDGRGVSVACVVGGRGGAVMCVVGVSEGVGGMWSSTARTSTTSGLQQRWRKWQQGRWWRLVYSGDGGQEGVGGVRGGSGDGNGIGVRKASVRALSLGTAEAALLRAWLAAEAVLLRLWLASSRVSVACGQRQQGRRRRLVYSGDGGSGRKGVGGVWYTAAMVAGRESATSGAAAAMETAARESAASGATAGSGSEVSLR